MSTALSDVTASFAPGLFRERQVLVSAASGSIGLERARSFLALGATVLATGSAAGAAPPTWSAQPCS